MELRIEVDDETAKGAQLVYDVLGIDLETAVKMFLKRTVLEQRLPLSTSVSAFERTGSASDAKLRRSKNVITKAMVEDIWRRFKRHVAEGGSANSIAAEAHGATGMNQGSAFIYLTILDNLVNGKHNTRNMKMADLEFYMDRIREDLDERSYCNAITSLRLSIPYWDKDEFGQFASKVQAYLDSIDGVGR